MNKQSIFLDRNGVNVILKSEVKPWVKSVLISLNLLMYSGLILLAIFGSKEAIGGVLIGSLIMFFTLSRFTLWNVYGEETLIINKKSLSYSKEFKLFQTPLKSIMLNNGIHIEISDTFNVESESSAILYFYTNDDFDVLSEIYRTGIKMEYSSIIYLKHLVDELFDNSEINEEESGFEIFYN